MKNVMDSFKLDGKVAIVTGASSGMGQASAVALAQAGADVLAVDINIPCQETRDMVEKTGQKYEEMKFDLSSDFLEADKIIEKAVETFGHADILVNVAGLIKYFSDFEHMDYEQHYKYVMDVNLNAQIYTCKAMVKQLMLQGNGGSIINYASTGAVNSNGMPGMPYGVSKAGVVHLTRDLAVEYGKYNIRVNAIAPGITKTNFLANCTDEILDQMTATVPMGRYQVAEDVMGPVVFLASDASSYVSGLLLLSDGGVTYKQP